MRIFDIQKIKVYPYEKREKNVLFACKDFKARIIQLLPGKEIPYCDMPSWVLFLCLRGEARVEINSKAKTIRKGQLLISEPGRFSMKTEKGVRLVGIQIPGGKNV